MIRSFTANGTSCPLITSTNSSCCVRRPCTLDVTLASYILILLHTPLPNPLLKTLLLESYPNLISHACLVHSRAFPSTATLQPPIIPPDHISPFTLIGRGVARVVNDTWYGSDGVAKKEPSAEEISMRRWRWCSGLVSISFARE